jgi:hypothetical protein
MATDITEQVIDNEFLASLVTKELAAADTWMGSGLAQEQEANLDYYYGDLFGNEEEGFSQVVSRDVMETVEGILPELMKLFASGDMVVEFDAIGPADEEQVEIEGRYINHVFMNRGNGYKVLYDWFKDALLMKNGIIKVEWDSKEQVQFRNYTMLTEAEYEVLIAGESEDELYIGSQYEVEDSVVYEIEDVTYYDCRVRISRMKGTPRIQPIASENFRIRQRSTSIQEASFVAHVENKTIGELLEEGYLEEDLKGAESGYFRANTVANARFQDPSESQTFGQSGWDADREVQVAECWTRVYCPEAKRVKLIRSINIADKCIEWEEVDRVNLISLSPIMMPHKFTGIAIADLVRDIQEIRSTVFRQMLDNLALQNSGRYTAVEGQVNLQDLIDNRIGGIVRQKMPGAVGRLDTPDLSQFTIPVLQQLDDIKENRTGVSRMTAGLDQSALSSHQTASAVNQVMTAAQGKILLIARNFAETGVKELFIEMYNQIREHQTTPDLVPISGRYALVNPKEWIERFDVHVTVGIGNGNKDQQLHHLSQISQLMSQIGGSPYGYLITAENVFNLANEFIKNSGYVNPTKFISNPANVEPPEPKPDPMLIAAQAQQMDSQANAQKKQADIELAKMQAQLDQMKFEWQKRIDAAEVVMEDTQKRPVGLQSGK